MQTPCADVKEPEDMQEYLARMTKQLEQMAAQHLQTTAPRRESLARATARYLERKASATDCTTAAAGTPQTPLSASNSTCRRQSVGGGTQARTLSCSGFAGGASSVPAQQEQQLPSASPAAAKHAKHKSDGGVYSGGESQQCSSDGTGTHVQLSATEAVDEQAASVGAPPKAAANNQLSAWEAPQQQQQQPMQSRISLFHSPQLQGGRSMRRTLQNDSNGSPCNQIAGGADAGMSSDETDLAVQGVGQQPLQQQWHQQQTKQNWDGNKAGLPNPSFRWQQPQLSTTPEKVPTGRSGSMRPPRGRAASQNGGMHQPAAPAVCRSASTGGSIGRAATAAAGPVSKAPHSYGSSAPSSRVVSRTNSSRGAASSGGAIEITKDMLQGSTGALTPEAGLALAEFVITPRAAANNEISFTSESVEPVPEHALLAAVKDAIDAAAAAVNKPEVLSPRLSRRFTADSMPGSARGTLSPASSFQREASSLKGRAIEACQFDLGSSTSGAAAGPAGFDGSSTGRSELECIAEQVQHQLLQEGLYPQPDDLQQQQQDEQHMAGSSLDANDYQQQLMTCSLNSYSEIVCQGSVDDSLLASTGATGANSIRAAARALGLTEDAPDAAPEAVATGTFDHAADVDDLCDMGLGAAIEVRKQHLCSSSEGEETQDEYEEREEEEAEQDQEESVMAKGDDMQQESAAPFATEISVNSSSGPWIGYRPRASSEPGAVPSKQHTLSSPVQQPQWLIAQSASSAAVAAASSAPTATAARSSSKHAALHCRGMHSSPNLLGSSPQQLSDMPLAQLGRVLGESGSSRARFRTSSGSSFFGSLMDSQHSTRSSGSSYGQNAPRSVLAQQQQQQQEQHQLQQQLVVTTNSRLGQQAQGIHSVAVAHLAARRAVCSQFLPVAINELSGNAVAATTTAAASADEISHTTGAACAAVVTASHASAPGMLEAAAVIPLRLNVSNNTTNSQTWEQDDVLLGSPAPSPAAFAQMQLQASIVAAAATSRLGLNNSVSAAQEEEEQQQQQQQQEQPCRGAAISDPASTSPDSISPSQPPVQQQQQQQQQQQCGKGCFTNTPLELAVAASASLEESVQAAGEPITTPAPEEDDCDDICINDSSYVLENTTVGGSSLLLGSNMASSSLRESYSPRQSAVAASSRDIVATSTAALSGTAAGIVHTTEIYGEANACSIRSSSSNSVGESPRLQQQHSEQHITEQQQPQLQQDLPTHAVGLHTMAAAAAAAGVGSVAMQDSYVSVEAADGSRDVLVVGHSMECDDALGGTEAAVAAMLLAAGARGASQWQQHLQQQQQCAGEADATGVDSGVHCDAKATGCEAAIEQKSPCPQQHASGPVQQHTDDHPSQVIMLQQQPQQEPTAVEQHQQEQQLLQLQLQGSIRKHVTSADGTGSVRSAGSSPAKAVSWGGRMLDCIASVLKGGSGKQRHGSESGSSSLGSSPSASHRRLSSGGDGVVGCMPFSRAHHQHLQQEWQQQQQQSPLAAAGGSETAAASQLLQMDQLVSDGQQQQCQQQAPAAVHGDAHTTVQLAAQTATCSTQACMHWDAVAVLLSRAAAVAVSGVGIAAAQGTPEPHLVSCGSTLHAPTLAVVALLLAASSFDAAEPVISSTVAQSEAAGGRSTADSACGDRALAVAAASVAIHAAAQVAAWELEGTDMGALEIDTDASGSRLANGVAAAAAAAVGTEALCVQEQQQYHSQSHAEQTGAVHVPGAAGEHIYAQPVISPGADELGDSLAIELSGVSSCSSIDLTGLPELLADVSKAQYSRPTSATYHAAKYAEPELSIQLHNSNTGSRSSSRVEQHTEEQPGQQEQQQQCKEMHHQPVSQLEQLQQQQQHITQVPQDPSHAEIVSSGIRSGTAAPAGSQASAAAAVEVDVNVAAAASQLQIVDSVPCDAANGARASQAVQTLKQLRLTRRSSVGGPQLGSTGGTAAAAAAAVVDSTDRQPYHYQNYQQPPEDCQQQLWEQQKQQQQQQQLPPLCLGHGLSGHPVEEEQQQPPEIWQQQKQSLHHQHQQYSCASLQLSVTDYYQQLLRKQQELEQQRLQQQHSAAAVPAAAVPLHSAAAANGPVDATSAISVVHAQACAAYTTNGATTNTASTGNKQLAALARLKRGALMRTRQLTAPAVQHSLGNSDAQYAANPTWGSAGGADTSGGGAAAAAGVSGIGVGTAVDAAPQTRRAWGVSTTAGVAPPEHPHQQQQQQFMQLRQRRQQQQQQRGAYGQNSMMQGRVEDPKPEGGAWQGDRDSVSSSGRDSGGEGGDSAAAAAAAKPFLKRKSRAVVGRKLDWSNVQSKTITRLDDRYVPVAKERKANSGPSYDPGVAAAQARAGLMAPGSGGAAGGRRSGRSRSTTSYTGYEPGYEMEIRSSTYYRPKGGNGSKAPSGGTIGGYAGPARAGISSAPAGNGGGYAAMHARSSSGDDAGGYGYGSRHGTTAAGGDYAGKTGVLNRGDGATVASRKVAASVFGSADVLGRGSSGGGALRDPAAAAAGATRGLDPQAPLDDLLNHVNSLIKEFDRMYK